MAIQKIDSSNPSVHARNLAVHIHELKDHFRDDIQLIRDPRAQALFETAAEVLGGLEKALNDYQEKNEVAWQNGD